MDAPRIAPYGEWESPLTAEAVAASSHVPDEARFVGDEVWWSEPIAAEGRQALLRRGPGGVEAVLAAPWNVRSGVHEYGGGAWTAVGATVVLSHLGDHRLHRLDGPGGDPVPLTPEGHGRFGGLVPGPAGRVLAVRERDAADGEILRDLVLVPLDGAAADDPVAIVQVVAGSRFVAQPALSPDGARLAWIAWDDPDMPWDGTELRIGDLVEGRVASWRAVLGGPRESVLQPAWLPDGGLAAITDRTGWWNLVRVDPDAEDEPVPIAPEPRETGGPLWVLGTRWYLPLHDGRILATSTLGVDEQRLIAPSGTSVLRAGRSRTTWQDVRGGRVLLTDTSAADPASLWELDTATGSFSLVRSGVEGLPIELFPAAEVVELDGVRAVLYPPSNPAFVAPDGTLPPYLVTVHGGPTSSAGVRANPAFAYWTSRGIGVADVDYAGSTGYGRAYRERLRGRWGVADVEDVIRLARALGGSGIADPARIGIEGGSAGGWTVLGALTSSDVFAWGVSRYGVSDAVALAEEGHGFEARYLDGLIGPYPEAAARYAERAPLHRVDRLASPVLLLQGLDDRVVPPAQSRRFRDAAAERGLPHALIEFPGEGHGFRGRDAIVRAAESALSFAGQVAGFTPPGVPVLPLER